MTWDRSRFSCRKRCLTRTAVSSFVFRFLRLVPGGIKHGVCLSIRCDSMRFKLLLCAGAFWQPHCVYLCLQVIQDVANMGFHPNDVRRVVNEIMQSGQSVDLNVVIDRLTRGGR